MLTHSDEQVIKKIVKEEITEQIRFVPDKDLFLSKMDELMSEVKGMREEFHAHMGIHEEISDKLEEHDQQLIVINKNLNLSY